MTPDERNLLTTFLSDLRARAGAAKDAEADQMILQAVSANPDAVYLLVQHANLSDQALHAAQAQIQDMQERAQPPQASGSFLAPQGGGFLSQPPEPDSYALQALPWEGPKGAPISSSPFAADSGLGGFLRSAGTMAAGVAVGDFLAQGISNIIGSRND